MDSEFVDLGNIKTGMEDRLFLERIKNVFRKISSAAIRSGRNPFDVKLVAVTKTVPVERIKAAASLGLRIFGEENTCTMSFRGKQGAGGAGENNLLQRSVFGL